MSFDDERRAKYERGILEHRPNGGSFKGDVLEEIVQEALDVANYADEAEIQGLVSGEEATELRRAAHTLYMHIRTIQIRPEVEPRRVRIVDAGSTRRAQSCAV